MPTLQRLRDAGARVVVAAHLGRPKPGCGQQQVLARARSRPASASCWARTSRSSQHGDEAKAAVERLTSGGVVLLENIRFDPRETSKDDDERRALRPASSPR